MYDGKNTEMSWVEQRTSPPSRRRPASSAGGFWNKGILWKGSVRMPGNVLRRLRESRRIQHTPSASAVVAAGADRGWLALERRGEAAAEEGRRQVEREMA